MNARQGRLYIEYQASQDYIARPYLSIKNERSYREDRQAWRLSPLNPRGR